MDSPLKLDSSEARLRRENIGSLTVNSSPASKFKPKQGKTVHISVLFFIFGAFLFTIVLLFLNFPPLEREQAEILLRLPRKFQDVKAMGEVLTLYTEEYYFIVLVTFCLVYLFLQTFSIPGSIFLSFLAGALFGLPVGVLLVTSVATMGATLCYLISLFIVRKLVKRLLPDKLELFGAQINKHRQSLLNYIFFLRVTPLLPNWFINLASPIFGVPVSTFMIGTFFGIMPATFVAVRAGLTLQQLESPSDVLNLSTILTLFGLGFLAIIPTLDPVKRRVDAFLNKAADAAPDPKVYE
eukprot:TRINITY_DN16749_c0_g1_i1.p1 TRINITY_DN16749_c0_g1~~TRINITY_DN16749_c0_g1_i1.p1  ORF type:complete len:296 (-),score=92.68 TRINITY_DN16749_c0_g1_i1:132-1019(-)